MLVPLFTLAAIAVGQASPARFSFWVEPRGIADAEAQVVLASFSQTAERREALASASRREEADLLLRLEVLTRASGTDEGGSPVLPFADPEEIPALDALETSGPNVTVRLGLLDVLKGQEIWERRFSCQLPLVQGRIVVWAPVRAHLSDAAKQMERWAQGAATLAAREHDYRIPPPERQRLGAEELAQRLYREALRASRAGYDETALDLLAEAQPLFKETGRRQEEGRAWEQLTYLMAAQGRELDKVESYAKQVIKIGRETGDPKVEPRGIANLGAVAARRGNYVEAQKLAESAREMSRAAGDRVTEAVATAHLGGLRALRGDFDGGRAIQQEALALLGEAGRRPAAEARLRLSMAVVEAYLDERDLKRTLAAIDEAERLARDLGDLGLDRDIAFVRSDARYGSTNLRYLLDGEADAIRALKICRRSGDSRGEAAALALVGAFSNKLGRPAAAAESLTRAIDLSRAVGFSEGVVDSLQLMGEMAPRFETGAALLSELVGLRRQIGGRRGEAKTLNDLSRLLSGLGNTEAAWERYREAADVVEAYVQKLQQGEESEDLQASFITTIKSLMTTRTDVPFLGGFLKIERLVPPLDPSWLEGPEGDRAP